MKSDKLNFTAEIIMIFFIIHFSFLKRGGGERKFLIPEKELSNIAFFVLLSFTAKESKKNTLISDMKFNVLKIVIAKTAERFRVPRCESRQELS